MIRIKFDLLVTPNPTPPASTTSETRLWWIPPMMPKKPTFPRNLIPPASLLVPTRFPKPICACLLICYYFYGVWFFNLIFMQLITWNFFIKTGKYAIVLKLQLLSSISITYLSEKMSILKQQHYMGLNCGRESYYGPNYNL